MQLDLAQLAEHTLMAANAIARATPIAWVIEANYLDNDECGKVITVAQAPLSDRPDAEHHIPQTAELLRSVVFPASQLADMPTDQRQRHRAHYRAFLMWNAAQVAGKPVECLKPWVDYDEVSIDDAVDAWARAGRRLA